MVVGHRRSAISSGLLRVAALTFFGLGAASAASSSKPFPDTPRNMAGIIQRLNYLVEEKTAEPLPMVGFLERLLCDRKVVHCLRGIHIDNSTIISTEEQLGWHEGLDVFPKCNDIPLCKSYSIRINSSSGHRLRAYEVEAMFRHRLDERFEWQHYGEGPYYSYLEYKSGKMYVANNVSFAVGQGHVVPYLEIKN